MKINNKRWGYYEKWGKKGKKVSEGLYSGWSYSCCGYNYNNIGDSSATGGKVPEQGKQE